ncbi:MAG TPA: TrmH family RNA methyltransferase [Allosphingosinicella sp.]|nr:TrmH family RNA methyltransferase [Allosphingosinicella sp.]
MADQHEELEIWRSGQRSGVGGIVPAAPAIVLHMPKYPHNVGQVVRLASAYGIAQVWYSGERIRAALGERLPREERMRRYEDVALINHPDPLARLCEAVPGACPVAVELRPGSESLVDFIHPDRDAPPVYIFGPEDGSLPGPIVKRCHRFVVIPSYECLNLATSVATILYDRMAKMPAATRPSVRERGPVQTAESRGR